MTKNIDMKNRIVEYYDLDTSDFDSSSGVRYEDQIANFLDKKMKVVFHSVVFNNSRYVFLGKAKEKINNAITVSSYRPKIPGERISVIVD